MTSDAEHDDFSGLPAVKTGHCAQCGRETQPDWDYCLGCGASQPDHPGHAAANPETDNALPALPTELLPAPGKPTRSVMSTTTASRTRRPWGRAVAIGLTTVLLCLAAAIGYWQRQTAHELDTTRHALASTRTRLNARTSTLSRVRADLATSQNELSAAQQQRDRLQERLQRVQSQLQGVEGTLTSAQSRLDLQASQIETLKSCLQGVSNSLVYASQNDYTSAVAAINAVQVSCHEAQSLF